jgi:hypothetical protein
MLEPSAGLERRRGAASTLQRTVGNRALQRLVQMGATMSRPGDTEELTADRDAERVLGAPGRARPRPESTTVPRTPGGRLLGGGDPLPATTRSFFEPRFFADFSQVRVHTDPEAAASARALGARAYTVGQDIVFDEGQYAPQSAEGQHILAHELAHVVQDSPRAALTVRRQPLLDVTWERAITLEEALTLTDAQLADRIGTIQSSLFILADGTDAYQTASSNVAMLQAVQLTREYEVFDPGQMDQVRGGEGTIVPAQLLGNVPPDVVAELPEGQIVELPAEALGPAAPVGTGGQGTGVRLLGPGLNVTGLAMREGVAQHLGRYGFASAGETAVGLVAFPQSRSARGVIDILGGRTPRFGGSGPFLPGSRIVLGHTGIYLRQGSVITDISSFATANTMEALMNFGAMRSGERGVTGAVFSHLESPFQPGGYMFDVPGARSMEMAIPEEWARAFAERIPPAGVVEGTSYVAQPELCQGANCVLWAEELLSRGISEQSGTPWRLGEAGGPPIVNIASGGREVPNAARQQVLLDFMDRVGRGEAQLPAVEGMGPAVVGEASRTIKVVRFGGTVFNVAGYAYSGHRIANASPEERTRVIGEEVGGQAGGTAGFYGGMGACVLLGIATEGFWLLVCGLAGGVAGGVGGSEAGGWLAESAQEAMTSVPVAAVEWYTDSMMESPNETVRTDGVALRRALLYDDMNAWLYLLGRF